jgi:L-threonylcarbamoyladenylate synthase
VFAQRHRDASDRPLRVTAARAGSVEGVGDGMGEGVGKAAWAASLARALERLADDGSVAFPTETTWGLAARAGSQAAVDGIRRWKGREDDKPISLMVAGRSALARHGFEVTPLAEALVERFWPGPLTLVLPCRQGLASGIAGPTGGVGVRCSPHPVAAALASASDLRGLGLLTATSLNRSGEAPATDAAQADALCAGADPSAPYRIECGAHDAGGAAPSTVLDLSGDVPAVLRWGALRVEALRACPGLESIPAGSVQ